MNWVVGSYNNSGEYIVQTDVDSEGDVETVQIATCWDAGHAAIIAGAPDALAAMRLTLETLENITSDEFAKGDDGPARLALRNAISKMEGKL